MKTSFVTLFLLCISIVGFSQKTRVLNKPSVEFSNSGIYQVSKIELSPKDTRLHIHSIFIPKWWVKYSDNDNIIIPETGDTLKPTSIIGSEFNKKLWMPASGDSTIILVYPPIDKKVKTITWYTEDDDQSIFGISLDPKTNHNIRRRTIPQDVEVWLEKELNAQEKQAPMNIHNGDLFKSGKAKIVGYIKGYDKRAGFSTGIVYLSNVFTREDYPTVITIHPDGRFETTLDLIHPIQSSLNIDNRWIDFYAEPGQITCLILDWDDFLMADRQRNINYQFKNIEFRGPLTKINQEINNFTPEAWDYKKVRRQISKMTPETYIAFEKECKKNSLANLEKYNTDKKLSENALKILKNSILLDYGSHLFSFPSTRSYLVRTDSTNKMLTLPLPKDYYTFLNDLPLNDPTIVINSTFKSFVNKFEYMDPISHRLIAKYKLNSYKPISTYECLKNNNVSLSDDEWELLKLASKKEKTATEIEHVKNNTDKIKRIYKNHEKLIQNRFEISRAEGLHKEWILKDSLIDATVQKNTQFVKDVIKVRALNSYCRRLDYEVAQLMWKNSKPLIQNSIIAQHGDDLIARLYTPKQAEGYELPKGKGTDIFKRIIDPYKGKVLFVDFWATTCGPCVGGITRMKHTREQYANSKNIEFIFITDERSSPLTSYTKLVKEQKLKNTYRLSKDEFYYLRELFKFNGIPHYALIDKSGKVLDDDFSMHNFKFELKTRFPEYAISAEEK